jgi:ketosteroid isomerase-like protein
MSPETKYADLTRGAAERKAPRMKDAAVRQRVESLAQTIRDKNVDAVMTHYAPDVRVYDVYSPPETRGADAYRKNFERWFASMQGPIQYEMQDLDIRLGGGVAFCHCQSHVTGTRAGEKADYWVRVTACLEEINGEWLVVHEHISMPAAMPRANQ